MMNTVASVYRNFVGSLDKDYDSGEAASVASLVFSEILGLSRIDLFTKGDRVLAEDDLNKLNNILSRLLTGMPVQYIIGHVMFQELEFQVNEHVLIPRRETEELVSWIIRDLKSPPESIVDFCTGSGCIAISLKKAFPSAQVTGIDISAEALNVASANAMRNSLSVEFKKSDLLSEDPGIHAGVFVSNPPYVMEKEASLMSDRVKKHEPHGALFVRDSDPLVFYRRISGLVKKAARESVIYYEINESMGKEISELHSQLGLNDYTIKKDLQGKDRFFKVILPAH